MTNFKRTLKQRVKSIIRAVKDKPIQNLTLGVEIRHCSECEKLEKLRRKPLIPVSCYKHVLLYCIERTGKLNFTLTEIVDLIESAYKDFENEKL